MKAPRYYYPQVHVEREESLNDLWLPLVFAVWGGIIKAGRVAGELRAVGVCAAVDDEWSPTIDFLCSGAEDDARDVLQESWYGK